ncbi:hypothetical protein CN402_20895 [Bacillus sp. AFS015896]|uniref:Uncharacterized protein n=1 Tax=Bacillus cereus TaxID=1396 RepID=A0A2C1LKR2_BACCE|nr:hypothetical protein CN476_19415 [Bacillus cereus]PFA58162.1 hypothetical protein CN402_20895 [Bacillus sp. AFS015896]PGT98468.1 hypothetical protein COD19_21745 [Bacillus cereus]PGX07948.1 hypothetical protein COE07_20675 [Bacillus sp. AFS033286]PGZ74484.1 hypothetical protein COE49_08670 [Bacillus sp. AFS029637]
MSISVSDELQLFAKELYRRKRKYEGNETVVLRICIFFLRKRNYFLFLYRKGVLYKKTETAHSRFCFFYYILK